MRIETQKESKTDKSVEETDSQTESHKQLNLGGQQVAFHVTLKRVRIKA